MEIFYNPSSWEVEAGGVGIQGHPGLYIEFETSLGYVRNLSQK